MTQFKNIDNLAPEGFITIAEYAKRNKTSRPWVYLRIKLGKIAPQNIVRVPVQDEIIFIKADTPHYTRKPKSEV